MHEVTGKANAKRAAQNEDIGEPPTWAGPHRIDFTSWEVEARLVEIRDAAAQGCVTCVLLKEAMIKATAGKADFDDGTLSLALILCRGNALRVRLLRGEEPEDDDDEDGFFSPFEEPSWTEFIGSYELYTLPGKLAMFLYLRQAAILSALAFVLTFCD